MLKNEVSGALCVLCSNLERSVTKSQLYYLNFKTTFCSWAKGNHREDHMLCRPVLAPSVLHSEAKIMALEPYLKS
jgi:hypothetical protein